MTLMGIKTKAFKLELESWRTFSHLHGCGAITIQGDFWGRVDTVGKEVGGTPVLSICPSISTQCFPLGGPLKKTIGKGAWEKMFATSATCIMGQGKSRQ